MKFILVDDEQRCNFCVYWTGMRKKDDDFVYADFDSAEWGICLHPKERRTVAKDIRRVSQAGP